MALKLVEAKEEDLNNVVNELINTKFLNHPNILKILQHYLILENRSISLFLVMEKGEMSLWEFLKRKTIGMNDSELSYTMKSLTSALDYAHQNRIVHCDIKPGNVILFPSNEGPLGYSLQLSDWGSAYEFKEFNHSITNAKTCMSFTLLFLAPELQEENRKGNFFYGDIFSLGVTFLSCAGIQFKDLKGFSVLGEQDLFELKLKKIINLMKSNGISQTASLEKIENMIKFEPHQRILPLHVKETGEMKQQLEV